MGATRDIALTDLPLRGISINPATADGSVTVVASDSGVVFVNKYAGTTTYTLPAVAAGKGKIFWFYDAVGEDLVVYGPAASTIFGPDLEGRTLTGTGDVGICCLVVGDGTDYYAWCIHGTWVTS